MPPKDRGVVMKYSDLYLKIKSTKYNESGNDVDWSIFVSDADKIVFLLFKCTDSDYDWKINFKFPCIMYKNNLMRVHKGYATTYKTANDHILTEFIKCVDTHPEYKVVIAGWSYGGAMAVLAAEDFNYRTRTDKNDVNSGKKATLITYGCPRIIGSSKGRKYVKSTIAADSKQFANRFDIVTHVVPFFWYKHICEVKLEKNYIINLWRIFRPHKYEHVKYDEIIIKNNKDGTI